MQSNTLEFTDFEGNALAARVDEPDDGYSRGMVLFAHCFTCGKNLNAIDDISRALTEEGMGVFRFDFTGLGESEGDFSDTNFSSNVDDLVAAAEFMEEEFEGPAMLMGHSLGGAAVLQAASRIKSAEAVVTIAAPGNPEHVTHMLTGHMDEIEEEGETEVNLAGRTFNIKQQFLDDLDEHNMENVISNLDKALLIFHSPVDNTVGIENAARIYERAKHPKSFISLDDADHLLSKAEDASYVAEVAAAWVRRYV